MSLVAEKADRGSSQPFGSYFQDCRELLVHGETALRRVAVEIAEAAIAGADPGSAIRQLMAVDGQLLTIGDRIFRLADGIRVFVIGAGKATFPIAKAIDDLIGPRIHRGLVTCKSGQHGHLAHIDLHLADHPIPGAASLEAAVRTQTLLQEVRSGDIVLSCFTGGSSALFVRPVDAIALDDKIDTNRVLLGCGANIVEINAVRKHLSQVKGGRLARQLPAGVHLINLTVSDVIGDPLDCITDPTVPDSTTFSDARAVIDRYDLWPRLPDSAARFLRAAPHDCETARASELAHLDRADHILVKNDAACLAAADAARARGFHPLILSSAFEGESRELGRFMAAIAKDIVRHGYPVPRPCVLIGGGETTVVLPGATGQGGPSQEFSVAVAIELAGYEGVVALGMDTDGTDGPTEFAGGLIDGSTAGRAVNLHLDLYKSLAEHNVSPALRRLGDLVVTGPTGTNVNDLRLVIIGPNARPPG
jgi:glycerate 2-kinase